jgi:hypothetical protein
MSGQKTTIASLKFSWVGQTGCAPQSMMSRPIEPRSLVRHIVKVLYAILTCRRVSSVTSVAENSPRLPSTDPCICAARSPPLVTTQACSECRHKFCPRDTCFTGRNLSCLMTGQARQCVQELARSGPMLIWGQQVCVVELVLVRSLLRHGIARLSASIVGVAFHGPHRPVRC